MNLPTVIVSTLLEDNGKIYGATFARWEENPNGVTTANGEAGEGIYGFFDNDRQLDDHYRQSSGGRRVRRVRFRLKPGAYVVDLRRPDVINKISAYAKAMGSGIKVSLQTMERAYWSLTQYYERDIPDAAGYIVPHFTPNTRSCQVVIKRPEQVEILD